MSNDTPAFVTKNDLTGRTFGRITVIRFSEKRLGVVYWIGRCQCGTEKEFGGANLIRGLSKSCGCGRFGVKADLSGRTFGMVTVLRLDRTENGRTYWWCKCDCGTEKPMRGDALTGGDSVSCGCYSRYKPGHDPTRKTHGMAGSSTYKAWKNMRSRCQQPKDAQYKYYGARGIYVCTRWDASFEAFFADMGARPSRKLSIDRANNEGSYTCGKHDLCDDCREKNAPANCQWATGREQGQNKRNNRLITAFGETHCVTEWSRRLSIDTQVLFSRLNRGYSLEEAIAEPPGTWNRINDDIVRDVRRRSELGERFDSIRRLYGFSERHTLDIIERVRYADVV